MTSLKQINVAVIGTGWCGGIRAETCAAHPLVKDLHVAETRPERLAEIKEKTSPVTATADYRDILAIQDLDAVMISATPESLHIPMAREASSRAGMSSLKRSRSSARSRRPHRDRPPQQAQVHDRLLTALPFKYAYVKRCIEDGTLGTSGQRAGERHITRGLVRKSPTQQAFTRGDGSDARSISCCGASSLPSRFGCTRRTLRRDADDDGRRNSRRAVDQVTMDSGFSFVVGGG